MLQNRSNRMRAVSILVAVIFMMVSIMASTESVSAASKLKVTITKKTIYVGQTTKLKANKNVKWKVTKTKVAKITKKGKKSVVIKGLRAGTTYVTAKAGKQTKKIKLVVKAKPKKFTLEASESVIGLGEYSTIFVKYGNSIGSAGDVTFTSSDKTIANVSSKGLVEGLSEGTVTITAKSRKDKSIKASIDIKVIPARAGRIYLTVDMTDESRYPAGKTAKVWLPVPQNNESQFITGVKCDAPAAARAELTTDSAGGKQFYVEWNEDTAPADRVAVLSYHLYRRAVIRDENIASKESGTFDPEEFAVYLQETRWSGKLDSGIVKETADKIVADAGAATVYAKAYAIYDWMCDNVTRIDDKTVIFGDVERMLDGTRNPGSCMDVSSMFVSLCRAEGIPARTTFGLRFAPKCGPNCRAEFYLPGYGWVVADPALAIKQSWGHESEYIGPDAPEAATWAGIKDKFWGNGEENWICVNMGRDIVLDPPQSVVTEEYNDVLNPAENGVSTINLFMFPYGEFDGQYIPCQKSAEFKYEYRFEEEDPTDCGC